VVSKVIVVAWLLARNDNNKLHIVQEAASMPALPICPLSLVSFFGVLLAGRGSARAGDNAEEPR